MLLIESLSFNSKEWDGESFMHQTNICSYKEHSLFGRVQIVDSFPDVKVQLVTSFPDLKVKVVDYQSTRCGEWQIVSEFPDLKVQFVNSFPDIKIQYVQDFPGLEDSKLK
jgi:hypothetical protein